MVTLTFTIVYLESMTSGSDVMTCLGDWWAGDIAGL